MLNYAKPFILYPLAEKYLGRDIRSKVKTLKLLAEQSFEDRSAHQQKRLAKVVANAGANVPYYRDLFRSIGFKPERLEQSSQYLQEIPLLTKDILREQGFRMLNERMCESELYRRRTNGSTGLVTNVWYDREALDWTAAVSMLASKMSGQRKTTPSVLLSSRFFEKLPAREAFVEKIRSWALNRTNIAVLSLNPAGLDDILKQLRAARPFTVQGHPSSLYFLALHAKEIGQDVHGLFNVFESTGESIDHAKAETIRSTFGCHIVNRYGNAEFGVIATSRSAIGELEIIDSVVFPESHSLGNGLEELIFTGLLNSAMPLIRYRTGDIGEVSTRSDGRQVINRLTGRVHDVVEIGGQRYPTHFLKELLERGGGIDEFQIVQSPNQKTVLRVVPNRNFEMKAVERRIQSLFGESMKIEVTTFDGLVLQGWRDKFRYLVRQ